MVYRIAQWGTGSVGAIAVQTMIAHPDYELVACFAHGAAKIGQDVGVFTGGAPIGVLATDRIEDIIAAKPDLVLYMPLVWDVDAMAKLLAAGIDVISTANFITGRSFGQAAVDQLEQAAQTGKATLFGTGLNPGLADILGLVATASCRQVYKVKVLESVDCTYYASAETWLALGFGGPADAPGLADKIKQRALVFIDAVEMLAAALKVELDEIAFDVEYGLADSDLDLGFMKISKGTVCGIKMIYAGKTGGNSVIEHSFMWRLGYSMTPDWPVEGYVVEVDGDPSIRATYHVIERKDALTSGSAATAMNAMHAIPRVIAARPGIVTAAELPLIVAAGTVVPPPN